MWDKVAGRYRDWAEMNSWYYRIFAREIAKFKRPKLVLDVCSGPGTLGREMRKIFDAEIIGIDSSREMCRISKGFLGDALNLPFKDEVFDLVTFCFALHEIDVEKAIREAKRVLKKDGIIAIADLNSRVPEILKILSSNFLSLILGPEYAENLLKKWRDFESVEEIESILKRENFKIEFVKVRLDFWLIAKKI